MRRPQSLCEIWNMQVVDHKWHFVNLARDQTHLRWHVSYADILYQSFSCTSLLMRRA